MTHYVGRHRAPATPLTSTLPVRGAVTLGSAAALGLAVPATATAAPSATETASTSETTSAARFNATVRAGDKGWIVRSIQRRLGIPVTGKYEMKTYYAVRHYQRDNGLTVDGMVGPWTGRKMGLPASYKTVKRTTSTTTAASRSTSRSSIVSTAAQYYGTPYRYGGTTTSGFDCSGFTQFVYRKHGKSIPRTAEQQRRAAWKTSNPRPGDLVFFGAPAYHVGIYAGSGKIIDAGRSGSSVTKRSIWTSSVTYGRF